MVAEAYTHTVCLLSCTGMHWVTRKKTHYCALEIPYETAFNQHSKFARK
jgi:hypothetical protein